MLVSRSKKAQFYDDFSCEETLQNDSKQETNLSFIDADTRTINFNHEPNQVTFF